MIAILVLMTGSAGGETAACVAKRDCERGLTCVKQVCQYVGLGESCAASNDCARHLRCQDKVCVSESTPLPAPASAAVEKPALAAVSVIASGQPYLVSFSRDTPTEFKRKRKRFIPVDEIATCQTPCAVQVPVGRYTIYAHADGMSEYLEEVYVPAVGGSWGITSGSQAKHDWGIVAVVGGSVVSLLALIELGGAISYFSQPGQGGSGAFGLTLSLLSGGLAAYLIAGGLVWINSNHAAFRILNPNEKISLQLAPTSDGGWAGLKVRF